MSTPDYTPCIKFGKKEHLEMLQKKGKLFFNSISYYRGEPNTFRGDVNEGTIYLNPQLFSIKDNNGNNIPIPKPDQIKMTFQNDDDIYLFCFSRVDSIITVPVNNMEQRLCDDFQSAVKNFGEYALVFWLEELHSHISQALSKLQPEMSLRSNKVLYLDKETEYDAISSEERKKHFFGDQTDIYFIKDEHYRMQNEHRILLVGSYERVPPNCGTGFMLQIDPLQFARLERTDVVLKTLCICQQ